MNALLQLREHLSSADLKGIRSGLNNAFHAPGWLYSSEELAVLEKQQLFLKSWMLACRADEISETGDYLTLKICDEPIIVARDKNGEVYASLNQCAHRGVEVAQGSGNTKKFTCPYHAWTYDVSGQLVAAPFSDTSGRDLSKCHLPRLQCTEWKGWIFVNFDLDAPSFKDFIDNWEAPLWFYQAERCTTAFKVTIEFNCNWKLVAENVSDLYHAGAVHGASFGSQFNLKDGSSPAELIPGGGWIMNFSTEQRQNFPQKFKTLPWLEDTPDFAAGKSAIFPNVNLFANRESMRTSVYRPLAVDRTEATWYFLLPEESLKEEGVEEGIDYYKEQIRTIAEEDRAVVESLQRAASSPLYVPGPLINMEEPIQHMVKYYLDFMGL